MSLHIDWLHTNYTTTEAVPAGSTLGDDCVSTGNVALVLHYDEAVVIEGPKADLLALLTAAIRQVEAVSFYDPVPPDYRDEDHPDFTP